MAPGRRYALHPACRVRQESFGLLFYDSRGPRLLFAATGSLLPPDGFRGQFDFEGLLKKIPTAGRENLSNFLRRLLEKGFLREQPLC
jgi:putative mycofactocin binding protein MftB